MNRLALIFCLIVSIAAQGFLVAQDTQKSGSKGAQTLAEQLKEKPDDSALFNKYMIQTLGKIRANLNSNPDKAEKQVERLKKVIESLEPETDNGKMLVTRANRVIKSFGQQLELARTTVEQLVAKLEENPNDTKSISMYLSKMSSSISPLTRTEPDKAEKMFNSAKDFLSALKEKAEEDSAKAMLNRASQSMASLERRIETGKRLKALVGQDAAPLEVEAWVNGDPLTDSDLKGKVVMLDFWAVWCGPCIATFPHLREWHEKYADKGLEIIGLTRYYQYTWDEEAGRAKRAGKDEEVTPEQEHEMLVKFAEQHNLHHRFAIQKDRSISDFYAVSGIPHVVVIDQQGKIRMFRIGSGKQNAEDIDNLLQELFSDVTAPKE